MSKPSIDAHIGARIKKLRTAHKLSPSQLAEKIGKSEPQMFRYESGTTPVPPALMVELAALFGIKNTHFMDGFK